MPPTYRDPARVNRIGAILGQHYSDRCEAMTQEQISDAYVRAIDAIFAAFRRVPKKSKASAD